MVAVRGQALVWPGFLIHSVSHPAYGCHPIREKVCVAAPVFE